MLPTYQITERPANLYCCALMHRVHETEWPTVGLFVLTYGLWACAVFLLADLALWLAILLTGVAVAFQASLQHEVIHGHPFRWRLANTMIAWPPLTLLVPYLRYRDTHLAHHRDSDLTDPYDDPESNYLDAGDWARLPGWTRKVLLFNNTLAGRLLVGPLVGTLFFLQHEMRGLGRDREVLAGWLWHLPGAFAVGAAVAVSPMPLWAYLAAVYLAMALLRIRTFLEHTAHDLARARTVIIEDRGPLALLFLNNNLHAVHHAHPGVAWFNLPGLYRRNRARFLAMNEGYAYRSYGEVFRRYLLRRKDPVAHPLWVRDTPLLQPDYIALDAVVAHEGYALGRVGAGQVACEFGQNDACDKWQVEAAHIGQRDPLQM